MQTARHVLSVCCLLLVLAGMAACTQTPPPTRPEVLASLADDLIVPRFQSVAAEMGELRDALDTLCANPTPDTLASAGTAWREARAPWMRSQATWFGPVMQRRSRMLVDWSSIDPERIEATLAKREYVSPGDVREFSDRRNAAWEPLNT